MSKLNASQAQDLAKYVISATPDAINPITSYEGSKMCAYTDEDDPKRHCVVGEIYTFLNVALPGEGQHPARSTEAQAMFEPWALDWLFRLQKAADHAEADDAGKMEPDPIPWGEALKRALS